jgi:hypothetical protein
MKNNVLRSFDLYEIKFTHELMVDYEISVPSSLSESELLVFLEKNCKKLSLDFSSGYNYDDLVPDKIKITKKNQYANSDLSIDWNESGQLELFFDDEEVATKLCNWSIIPNE